MYIKVYKARKLIRDFANLDSSLFCKMLESAPIVRGGKFHIQAFNDDWIKLEDFYSNQLPFEPEGDGYRK
jgi:hypothetical protein